MTGTLTMSIVVLIPESTRTGTCRPGRPSPYRGLCFPADLSKRPVF